MLNVLGENYYLDLDQIEKYLDITDVGVLDSSGTTEIKINIIKYEFVKMMVEVIFTENAEMDDKLGMKGSNSALTIPFKIAFNTLLYKNLINHY